MTYIGSVTASINTYNLYNIMFFTAPYRYAEKYTIFGRQRLTSGEVALDRSGQKGLSVIANPLVKMAHSKFRHCYV